MGRWVSLRGACLFGLLPLAAAVAASLDARPSSAPSSAPIHIVPGGAGDRDGRDWANAGGLAELPVLAVPGSRVWIRADLGPYRIERPIELRSGGAAGAPTTVAGVDASGTPMRAVLTGQRTAPYRPDGDSGGEVFRLLAGANHLRFRDLAFRDQGHCFRIAADVADLEITGMGAENVRRFIENSHTGEGGTATIAGLTVRNVQIRGFSKDAIRLQYDTHDVLIEDVLGDSQHQDGDDFAEGVTFDGTAHDITLRRVTMRNIRDSARVFWNGDGFSSEPGNYRLRFEDTVSSGNTDAGYDLKSSDTTLVRASASDNAANFKLWGKGIILTDCVGLAPYKRGGTNGQNQVETVAGATVTMRGCRLVDSDPATVVLKIGDASTLDLGNTTIVRHPDSRFSDLAPAASLAAAR